MIVALAGRKQIASGTWAFSLDLAGQEFPFRPGQAIELIIPEPAYADVSGSVRTFSLAGAPGRDHLLVATRVRGSAFKRSLVEASLGTPLEVEGPYGSFTLPDEFSTVALLAGGIGVTPFRSMVEEAIRRSLPHPLLLIHSSRTPEEAPFLDELSSWGSAHPGFTYWPTMTQSESSRLAWGGDRRRIGSELLRDALAGDGDRSLYYAAGPARFVRAAVEALTAFGVAADRIRFEEFPGY